MEFLVSRGPSIANERRFKISDPPNNTRKDSEFLIPQQTRKRIQISDPPKNTTKGSEFRAQEKIQNFSSPKMTNTRMLNFRSPTTKHKSIQNFWSPTEQDSQILIPKEHSLKRNQNFWSPKQPERKKIPLWAQSSHKICS